MSTLTSTLLASNDPAEMARLLRSVGGDLSVLDSDLSSRMRQIRPFDDFERRYPLLVHSLMRNLRRRESPGPCPDDALVLFDALVQAHRGEEHTMGMPLALLALNQPSWRLQAIDRAAGFFRTAGDFRNSWNTPVIAFIRRWDGYDAVSDVMRHPDETSHGIAQMLDALRDIGIDTGQAFHYAPPLSHACRGLHPVEIEGFIRHLGVEALNTRADNSGRAPLHDAAIGNGFDAGRGGDVTWLVRHGADPLMPDDRGNVALTLAAEVGEIGSMRALLSTGAYGEKHLQDALEACTSPTGRALVQAHQARWVVTDSCVEAVTQGIRPL